MMPTGCPLLSRSCCLAFILLTGSHVGWANDASDKARITKARAEADVALAAQEAECRQRFVVNACLIEARKQHRSVVEPLREELLQIDEKQRKQRAVDRADRIRAKAESASGSSAGDAAATGGLAAASAPAVRSPRAPRPLIRPKLRSISPPSDGSPADMPAVDSAGEVPASTPNVDSGAGTTMTAPARTSKRLTPAPNPNALQQSTERMREIDARREAVLKRNAERAAKKPPSAALPIPEFPASQPR